jgi:hypothetical protein
MKKKTPKITGQKTTARRRAVASLRAEYDFSAGTRGKYTRRVPAGTYLVLLDPDVALEFKSERDVNQALREFLKDRSR